MKKILIASIFVILIPLITFLLLPAKVLSKDEIALAECMVLMHNKNSNFYQRFSFKESFKTSLDKEFFLRKICESKTVSF